MPTFVVETPRERYPVEVSRGALGSLAAHIPARAGKLFIVTTQDVWNLHAARMQSALGSRAFEVLLFPGGEERKRMASVEALADQMVQLGADRSSLVIAFGGGIAGDLGGFLAAIFMRGIPVIQVPTTLLAQVDAAVGGKTGANLVGGKNLIGAFHQPLAVLIDPDVLTTLPPREYRAGLFEVLKCGVIRSPGLFERMANDSAKVLAMDPAIVEEIIAESVRIKAEVVSADEKEGGLRRILNYGHTIGHALEAETQYKHLLHGEAVAFGMRAVGHLAQLTGVCEAADVRRMNDAISAYGELPSLAGITAGSLVARLGSDKKTIQGKVHFVLAESIGSVVVRSGIEERLIHEATGMALRELAAA
ncbi:MAG: 3-dehydroquinate synthase [Bryobacterales bacterium]|nr:3-dehydroquinate synthase [Bryobacterales bacterium]